jgi:rod shape-determining protein MreD
MTFANLIAFPVLIFALMIQNVIISRLPLTSGNADIILLILIAWALQERVKSTWLWALVGGLLVSFVSAVPGFGPVWGYFIIVFISRYLQKRIWQIPILAMLAVTLIGTLIQHTINLLLLFVAGIPIPIQESLLSVTLPSALLNLLFALPIYIVFTDLAKLLYPIEVEP